jgi:hypothetical protein
MSILGWIILGLIAGFIASKIVNRQGEGFFEVGGWLFDGRLGAYPRSWPRAALVDTVGTDFFRGPGEAGRYAQLSNGSPDRFSAAAFDERGFGRIIAAQTEANSKGKRGSCSRPVACAHITGMGRS